MPWKGGPNLYGKHPIAPGAAAKITQAIECHIEAYAPGAYSQKHGHLNSACFYIIKGRGHDIHDGRRIDWKAGDVMFVENGCVHQHFNDDPDNEAILLVFKAKPLFLFMHLLYQKMISYPPNTLPKGHEDWTPPDRLLICHASENEMKILDERDFAHEGKKTCQFPRRRHREFRRFPRGL